MPKCEMHLLQVKHVSSDEIKCKTPLRAAFSLKNRFLHHCQTCPYMFMSYVWLLLCFNFMYGLIDLYFLIRYVWFDLPIFLLLR